MPLLVGDVSCVMRTSARSLPASIGTFSFNQARGQGVHVLIRSAEARNIGSPDRLRTALHCNAFVGTIRSHNEVGVALQHLRHHRMMPTQGSLNETYRALIKFLRGSVPPFPGEFLSPNHETARCRSCLLLTGSYDHINKGSSTVVAPHFMHIRNSRNVESYHNGDV